MTIDEARKIAKICETADGGCSVCVESLRVLLQNNFPQFTWSKGSRDFETTIEVSDDR